MSAQNMIVNAVDPDGKWLYRVGSIAAFILVIGWFLTIPLYVSTGTLPIGTEARLIHYAPHLTEWWVILGLMVFTDLFYLGITLALYFALKKIDQNMMLLFIACKVLFVVLDLAVLWPNKAALFTLSSGYAAAVTDAQRAAIVMAAASPAAVLDSVLPSIYSLVIPSLGTLFISLVMVRGVFSKSAGYLGLAAAVTGIMAVADPFMGAWGKAQYVNAILATIWYLIVGFKLYKLGQTPKAEVSAFAPSPDTVRA